MTIFQLDQCLNDKTLADACNAQGMCTVYRYPRRLTGQFDEVMLPVVFSRNTTLLTTDRTIIEDNESSIVAPNNNGICATLALRKRQLVPCCRNTRCGITGEEPCWRLTRGMLSAPFFGSAPFRRSDDRLLSGWRAATGLVGCRGAMKVSSLPESVQRRNASRSAVAHLCAWSASDTHTIRAAETWETALSDQ